MLKLIYAKYSLSNGDSSDIKFDSKFKLSDKFQLTGMNLAAGANDVCSVSYNNIITSSVDSSLSDLTGEELEKYLFYKLNLSATDKVNCDVIVNPQTGFEYKFVFVLIGLFVLSVYFIISNQKKLNINK